MHPMPHEQLIPYLMVVVFLGMALVAILNMTRTGWRLFRRKPHDPRVPHGYRLRPHDVTAVQFLGQDGVGVCNDPGCPWVVGDTPAGPHINRDHGYTPVDIGEWFLTEGGADGKGRITVMDPVSFLKTYELDE